MKPGRQYAKGAKRERQRVAWHYAQGAKWAIRAAGSHSPFDVVAVYEDRVELEQIKSGVKPTKMDRVKFYCAAQRMSCTDVVMTLVWWPDRKEPVNVWTSIPPLQ